MKFDLGDEVFNFEFGNGYVDKVDKEIEVLYETMARHRYTPTGKEYEDDQYPVLFHGHDLYKNIPISWKRRPNVEAKVGEVYWVCDEFSKDETLKLCIGHNAYEAPLFTSSVENLSECIGSTYDHWRKVNKNG